MTELAIPERGGVAVPAPQLPVPAMDDIDSWTRIVVQVVRLAEEICNTPFVPDGLRGSAPAVSAAILSGREMGLGPMTSLANIDVIKGKPTQKPLLMRAMVQARGHKWVDVDVSDVRAVVKGCRKGETEWTEVTFTAAQAKQGGIDLGKYPADKLYARASSRLAKRKFADVIMGMAYSSDEAEDDDGPAADTATGEVTAGPAAPVAPRTAQRRPRAHAPSPAAPETPRSGPAVPPSEVAAAGEGLPPLPGEEEGPTGAGPAPASASTAAPAGAETARPDDAPNGERHRKLVGIVQGHFKRLGFTEEEKPQRLEVAAVIANIGEIASLNDMHPDELSTVADTLSRCRNRDALTALLVAGDKGE